MGEGEGQGKGSKTQVGDLRHAVLQLRAEVRRLADRVDDLGRLAQGMEATESDKPSQAERAARQATAAEGNFNLILRPIPELAMAAVVETCLRGLPQVRILNEVRRDSQEVAYNLDLVTRENFEDALSQAVPVPLEVLSSSEAEIVLRILPNWGAAQNH